VRHITNHPVQIMSAATDPLRAQLAKFLDWEAGHASFDSAVADLDPALRGVRPDGVPYSPWELVDHLYRTQNDILDFCVNSAYAEKKWPADYWPGAAAPPNSAAWQTCISAYREDRKAMQALANDEGRDLFARIPHGTGQTYLREILLVVDHAAYHIGQLIVVRRLLGAWPA
jgi:hypothetical protein